MSRAVGSRRTRRCPGRGPSPDADAELVELVRAQAPLRRAVARLAGRLVAVRGWERLGFARLRDYAVERLGVSARSIQDLAHVDGRLAELPRIEAAFVGGEISWTKTRLLTRVATPSDESHWLAFARSVTARELAREVRAVDQGSLEAGALAQEGAFGSALLVKRGDGGEQSETGSGSEEEGGGSEESWGSDEEGAPGDLRETVMLRCTPVVRAKWHRARQLARRVAGESLPVWACMEAVAAEVASALPVDFHVHEGPLDARVGGLAVVPTRKQPAGAPLRSIAANGCGEHVAAELDPFELDGQLRRLMAREQRLEARMGPLLLGLADTRMYRALGARSLEAYSRERLGISPRKVRALLRVERAGRRAPAFARAFRAGRLSWVRAHALVPLITAAGSSRPGAARWVSAWVDWAQQIPVRRLEDDVERALIACETDLGSQPAPPGAELESGCRADGQTGAQATLRADRLETARPFFSAPRPVARFFRAVLCSVRRHLERVELARGSPARRLPTEGEGLEAMLDHAIAVWSEPERRVSRAHRVFARDGWRCTVPGCSSYRNLHDHHIVFRSAGGSDDLSNRTTLCAWHHLRGVHAGVVRCTGRAPEGLVFELGLRCGRWRQEDRSPLVTYRSGDRLAEAASTA